MSLSTIYLPKKISKPALKLFTVDIKVSITTIVHSSPQLTVTFRDVSSRIFSGFFDIKQRCVIYYKSLVLGKTRRFASLLLVY
jgi:hypothetical protein